ncbi:MAG: type II toxin-antitoxin system RelE/ParE family toxin [Cyclobacteriaceae bacterium]
MARYPETGPITEREGVRVKIVRDYKIFYRISNDRIDIIRVWNTHQDPDKLQMKWHQMKMRYCR